MPLPFAQASLLRPQFKLLVCPLCGMPCEWRYDKKDRPFVHCSGCWTRIFIYTPSAIIGVQMVQEAILRHGPGRWATEVSRRVMESVRRSGGFGMKVTASPMHRLLPPRRARPAPIIPRR